MELQLVDGVERLQARRFLLLIFLLLLSVSGIGAWSQWKKAEPLRQAIKAQVAALKKNHQTLLEQEDRLHAERDALLKTRPPGEAGMPEERSDELVLLNSNLADIQLAKKQLEVYLASMRTMPASARWWSGSPPFRPCGALLIGLPIAAIGLVMAILGPGRTTARILSVVAALLVINTLIGVYYLVK